MASTITRTTKPKTRRTPGGLGTVEQLLSGTWRAFYRRDGRRFTAPHTFTTKAEANTWLATESADRTRGVWRDPDVGRITLATYARDWIGSRPKLAPRTRDNYERHLRRWILPRIGQVDGSRGVELGAMDVADLNPAVIRAWYAAIYAHAHANAAKRLARESERLIHPAQVWATAQGLAVASTGAYLAYGSRSVGGRW